MLFRSEELKEISGNRDMTQGGTAGGVMAASAIAALQEAGSNLSRDMLKSAFRAVNTTQRLTGLVACSRWCTRTMPCLLYTSKTSPSPAVPPPLIGEASQQQRELGSPVRLSLIHIFCRCIGAGFFGSPAGLFLLGCPLALAQVQPLCRKDVYKRQLRQSTGPRRR